MQRINFKSKKKLNSEVIQNDEILVICQYLLAKQQRFRDYKSTVAHCAGN